MAIVVVRDGDEDADDKAADQDYGCDRLMLVGDGHQYKQVLN